MLTNYVITCVFLPNALSRYSHACTFSYKCTAHVWFARVFEHSFYGVCVALLYFGFSLMSQCQEGVILMRNAWKKVPISHGLEDTTRIQTKRFVLLARRAST